MTILPPNNEIPPPVPEADEGPVPIDTPDDPERQQAPGADQPPLGAPRDEPDPAGATG